MPPLKRRFSGAVALLALSLSAACQDKSPAITAVNREIGVSFSPSLIAYREFDPTELDSEHGWAKGGGFKAAAPFETLSNHWKHASTTTTPYAAGLITNDIFVGIGPTFAPISRLSVTPEGDAEYREWHRGLPHNDLDLIEHYTFWAPGGGVRVAYNPMGRCVVTARGGIAHTVFPTMAGSGDAAFEVPPASFSLGTRNVWQAGLGTDYAIGHRIHAFAGIDYSRFGFSESAYVYAGPVLKENHHEPDSVTDLAKVNVGFAWSY